jgi:hypothetical protein
VSTLFRKLILLGDSTRNVQLRGLGIEVGRLDADEEVQRYTFAGISSGGALCCDSAYCTGAQQIIGANKVIEMPLVRQLFSVCVDDSMLEWSVRTMSSESSGKRVALPDPSLFRIFCLMSLISVDMGWYTQQDHPRLSSSHGPQRYAKGTGHGFLCCCGAARVMVDVDRGVERPEGVVQ